MDKPFSSLFEKKKAYTHTHTHTHTQHNTHIGFPGGLVGKDPICNAGDTGDVDLIPGLERSPEGGHNKLL